MERSKVSIWLEPTAVKGSSVKPGADDKISLPLLCYCSDFCQNDLKLSLKRKWFYIDPNCTPSSHCLFIFIFYNSFNEDLFLLRKNHFDIQAALSYGVPLLAFCFPVLWVFLDTCQMVCWSPTCPMVPPLTSSCLMSAWPLRSRWETWTTSCFPWSVGTFLCAGVCVCACTSDCVCVLCVCLHKWLCVCVMCVPAQVTVCVCYVCACTSDCVCLCYVCACASDCGCVCVHLLPLFRLEAGNQGFLTDLKPQLQVLEISGERKAKLAKCSWCASVAYLIPICLRTFPIQLLILFCM